VTDSECVRLLQSCLPRVGLQWRGFRKVRRIVRRRIECRLTELDLPDTAAYRRYLESNAEEWAVVGATERVPEGLGGLVAWSSRLRIYRTAAPAGAGVKTT
jgi:hypothetical protein